MIRVSASQGTQFTARKIFFGIYSMSGIKVRVGYGFQLDAFPNNSLYVEERMHAQNMGQSRRQGANKELTVDDFFSTKPQPAQSLKQFKDNLKFKLHHLGRNEQLNTKFMERISKLKQDKRKIS